MVGDSSFFFGQMFRDIIVPLRMLHTEMEAEAGWLMELGRLWRVTRGG